MKYKLLTFHSSNEAYHQQAVELFSKKITHYCDFEYSSLKTKHFPRERSSLKVDFEEKELLKNLKQNDRIILFDEKGKSFSSEQLSEKLQHFQETTAGDIVFIVGGAYGVGEKIKAKAHLQLSLSSFVLNHHVAQVVVLEQIYRALTIQRGIPYHNK